MSAIIIDNIATARLEAGRTYELAAREHVITTSISVPSNVTIFADGATIVYSGKNPPVWSVFKKQNVRIGGGDYKLGPQNYVAFLEHGTNYRLEYANVIGGALPDKHSGGLAIIRGSSNVLIDKCSAQTVNRYLLFLESNNFGVLIRECTLTRGSVEESGIRICDSKSVTLLKNFVWCELPGAKNSALRMQDGENFQVIGGHYKGGFGAGPLADGDGGRNETDPKKRAEKINKRLRGVTVIDALIDGPVTLEAGLENYWHTGGRIESPQIFTGITWRYPENPEWTKPGDVIRSQAQGVMVDVNIDGEVKDNPIELIDCRYVGDSVSIPAVKK